jgi:hypothetical protein
MLQASPANIRPRANVIKTLFGVTYKWANKLVFIPGRPLQHTLMFVDKAKSGAPFRSWSELTFGKELITTVKRFIVKIPG